MIHRTENTVQDSARLDVQQLGGFLLRNNSGVDNSRARPVRYGLGNDSKEIIKTRKTADLIGAVPVLIKQHHVGTVLGVFVAVEAKAPDWKYSANNERWVAQSKGLEMVNKVGGVGFFLNDTGVLVPYLQQQLKL